MLFYYCRGIPPGGNIKLLKLPPEQWNQLMTVQTSGTSVYQDIIFPFRSNPNVKIEIEAGSCTLHITGEPNAVNSAYEHVLNHLSKELYVTDRYMTYYYNEIYCIVFTNAPIVFLTDSGWKD